MRFASYNDAVHYLTTQLHKSAPQLLGDEGALAHSRSLLAALGNPQDSVPAVHIAATSGKGSTSYAIETLLRAHGFRTTLMVSPHAYDIRERIQQNGRLITQSAFTQLAEQLLNVLEQHQLTPTYFEALMGMGFLAAAAEQPDYLVVETGLGGLWDTSNAISRRDKLAVVGAIGLDHTHILGTTLPEIATQKAGIMPHDGIAIALQQSSDINDVFTRTAQERNTTLNWVSPQGLAHHTNQQLARAAVATLAQRDAWAFDEARAAAALDTLVVPARFEVRTIKGRTIVLDAAHNPQKAQALAAWLAQHYPGQRFTTILATSQGKDAAGIIRALNGATQHYLLTAFMSDQQDLPVHAVPAPELAALARAHAGDRPIQHFTHARDALAYALAHSTTPLLITGSFYLAGELGAALEHDA